MGKKKYPMTPAIRMLREQHVAFSLYQYTYNEKGGTAAAANALGADEHHMVKTLVMEDENKEAFLILMHGDREVSTKRLARVLEKKTIQPCDPQVAYKHTGYVVGGISPFGTKKKLTVLAEQTILTLPTVFINAGKRGWLAKIHPNDLEFILKPVYVQVAV